MKNTKLQQKIMLLNEKIHLTSYDVASVVEKLKKINETCKRKFDESVDLSIGLQLNKKDNASIRGSCDLTHGHGKKIKILVFAEGKMGDLAKAQGADIVGGVELINKIKNNEIILNVHHCIAVESMMKELTKIAPILSGKKLMPNKKDGTILVDNEEVVKNTIHNMKNKTVFFKNDKHNFICLSVGKISFSEKQLIEHITLVLNTIRSFNKNPKISFFKSIHISTTMGVGLPLSI